MRVLAVDDDKLIRMEMELMLGRDGLQVDTAANCAEAHDLLRANHYDVVLTDMDLPDECGLEVLRRAKAKDPAVRVILVTGSASVMSDEDAAAAGADALILKPFRLQDLLSEVRHALPRADFIDGISSGS